MTSSGFLMPPHQRVTQTRSISNLCSPAITDGTLVKDGARCRRMGDLLQSGPPAQPMWIADGADTARKLGSSESEPHYAFEPDADGLSESGVTR